MNNFAKIIMLGMFSIILPCLADVVSPAYYDDSQYVKVADIAEKADPDADPVRGQYVKVADIAEKVTKFTLADGFSIGLFYNYIYMVVLEFLLISLLIIVFNCVKSMFTSKKNVQQAGVKVPAQPFGKRYKKAFIISLIVVAILNLIMMLYYAYQRILVLEYVDKIRAEGAIRYTPQGYKTCLSGKDDHEWEKSNNNTEKCKKCHLIYHPESRPNRRYPDHRIPTSEW